MWYGNDAAWACALLRRARAQKERSVRSRPVPRITGLVTILWWAFGYSLVFGKNFNNPFYGGSEFFFFNGVTSAPNIDYSFWVSQNVYAMFQLMFAIITPALIVGAIAERIKYTTLLIS